MSKTWNILNYEFGRSNNLSLKYKGIQHQVAKIIGIRKFEFVAKSSLLNVNKRNVNFFSTSVRLNLVILENVFETHYYRDDIEIWTKNGRLE